MKLIEVNDMHCEKCVERIANLMKQEGLLCSVNLMEKTVSVEENEASIKLALELLEDLGFTPTIK